MRKILLIALVALLAPVLSTAQTNKAVQRTIITNLLSVENMHRVIVPVQTVAELPTAGTVTSVDGYTLSAWVKVTDRNAATHTYTPHHYTLIFGYGGTDHLNTNGCWNLLATNDGSYFLNGWGLNLETGSDANFDTTKKLELNTWTHLTMVMDNVNKKYQFYINGELYGEKATKGATQWFNNENPYFYFAGFGFGGLLDEACVFNKPLTAAEVSEVYVDPLNVGDCLTGYYTFDEVTGTGQFANHSTNTATTSYNAIYDVATGVKSQNNFDVNGPSGVIHGESAPTLAESDHVITQTETTLAVPVPENGTIEVKDADGNTYASQAADHTIMTGTILTVTATPAKGYVLNEINVTTGTTSFTLASGESFAVMGETTIEAEFIHESKFATVTITAPTNGGLSVKDGATDITSGTKVAKGTVLTLSNEAPEGFAFDYYTINDLKYSKDTYTVKSDVTISVAFKEVVETPTPEVHDYCIPNGGVALGTIRGNGRKLNSFTVSDNNSNSTGTISVGQAGTASSAIYFDKTGSTLTTSAGANISCAVDWSGSWMHGYMFVDYNNDGEFNQTVNADGTVNHTDANPGEVVAFSYYNTADANGASAPNSAGITVSREHVKDTMPIPAFTLPANLQPGSYRARLKIDWNSIDACGNSSWDGTTTGNDADNRIEVTMGAIADFTIVIPEPAPVYHALTVNITGDNINNCDWVASSGIKGGKYTYKDKNGNKVTVDIKEPDGEIFTQETGILDGSDLYFFTNSKERLAADSTSIDKIKILSVINATSGGTDLVTETLPYENAEYWNDYTTVGSETLISNYKDGMWYFYSTGIANDVTINLTFVEGSSEIDGVESEETIDANAPVEYFNLQGMKVSSENLAPGFYIVRKGTKASKVYINK